MKETMVTKRRYYFGPGELEKKLGLKGEIKELKHHAGNVHWVIIMTPEGDPEDNDDG